MRKFKVLIIVLAAALLLAGCTGSNSKKTNGDSPETRLQDARSQLDAATYLGLKMTGSDLPKKGSILVKVSGTGTHEPPAFTGTATVKTSGQEIKADLIAVDKVVYAKLPFVGWNELDPAEYGAPDPAALMAKENGISSLLTDAAKLKDSGDERDGSDVLTKIEGTVPGEKIKALFPGAGDGDFAGTFTLSDANELREARLTGPFYPGSGDVTYTVTFNPHAKKVDIKAP